MTAINAINAVRKSSRGHVIREVLRPPGPSIAYLVGPNGEWMLIDAESISEVQASNWCIQWKNGTAQRVKSGGGQGLHNLLKIAPAGCVVDHINRNPLDNRLCNLRVATLKQNTHNRAAHTGRTSIYKGVSADKGSWRACIWADGRSRNLGRYKSEEDAARAYDKAAVELQGDFAVLNFPKEILP